MEIEEIASSEEENNFTDDEMRHQQKGKEVAMNKENEPVIPETPDSLSNQDWKEFNLIDEQYGTQWEGHDPNMEEPHEMTMIPQSKSPTENDENNAEQATQILANVKTCTESSGHGQISNEMLWSKQYLKQQQHDNLFGTDIAAYFIDDIHLAIQDDPKRFSTGLRRMFKELMNYCPHWNLRCWEDEDETWEDHIQLCEHDKICQICG